MTFDYFQIKRIRIKANLSQATLATNLNTHQCVISMLESGKIINPSFGLIMKVCNALGVRAEDLIIKK